MAPSGVGIRAVASSAVVVAVRAFDRRAEAEVDLIAPGKSGSQGETVTAVVVLSTTFRNGNALFLKGTPSCSKRTNTVSAAVVTQRAIIRNGHADALILAEGESGLESQALAAVVPSGAAFRGCNASPAVGAPS